MSDGLDLAGMVGAAAGRRGLRRRDDVHEPGWTFWELRNINMHRAVGLLEADRTFADARSLEDELRGAIARNFKRAWWRGLAYGVVARVPPLRWRPDDLAPLVDIRETSRGVLQWVVLVFEADRSAIAMHTWEAAFLSQVYGDTLTALSQAGYRVATAVKGKDGLLRFLTGVSGLMGVSFPEIREQEVGAPNEGSH